MREKMIFFFLLFKMKRWLAFCRSFDAFLLTPRTIRQYSYVWQIPLSVYFALEAMSVYNITNLIHKG